MRDDDAMGERRQRPVKFTGMLVNKNSQKVFVTTYHNRSYAGSPSFLKKERHEEQRWTRVQTEGVEAMMDNIVANVFNSTFLLFNQNSDPVLVQRFDTINRKGTIQWIK
jgi:hypothetical protein